MFDLGASMFIDLGWFSSILDKFAPAGGAAPLYFDTRKSLFFDTRCTLTPALLFFFDTRFFRWHPLPPHPAREGVAFFDIRKPFFDTRSRVTVVKEEGFADQGPKGPFKGPQYGQRRSDAQTIL